MNFKAKHELGCMNEHCVAHILLFLLFHTLDRVVQYRIICIASMSHEWTQVNSAQHSIKEYLFACCCALCNALPASIEKQPSQKSCLLVLAQCAQTQRDSLSLRSLLVSKSALPYLGWLVGYEWTQCYTRSLPSHGPGWSGLGYRKLMWHSLCMRCDSLIISHIIWYHCSASDYSKES